MENNNSRRHFIQTAAAGSVAITWLGAHSGPNAKETGSHVVIRNSQSVAVKRGGTAE